MTYTALPVGLTAMALAPASSESVLHPLVVRAATQSSGTRPPTAGAAAAAGAGAPAKARSAAAAKARTVALMQLLSAGLRDN